MNLVQQFIYGISPMSACDFCVAKNVGIAGDVPKDQRRSFRERFQLLLGKGCCSICRLDWMIIQAKP
ncbi:hypothetical protein [Sphingobium sp. AP50]|uniref:hypothetical protein n=1 Tax=Sphingobium sp. AP50 TaxID=1884369 RepID=UPI0011609EC0|nr:hypothetical protein [Sphingobium sp. AP50]